MAQTRSQNKTAGKLNEVFAEEPPSANETFFGAFSQRINELIG